jgi:hypothetical protein
MSKYRKNPVVIEAVQFTQEASQKPQFNIDDDRIFGLTTRHNIPVCVDGEGTKSLKIKTLEGTLTANIGDWIIVGVKGELYPCRDDIFKQTYEPA